MSISGNDEISNLNHSVAKDTIRCVMMEYIDRSAIIYNVTLCSDHHRDGSNTSCTKLNHDVNTRNFLNQMIEMGWEFDEVYIDYFGMPAAYARSMLRPQFFHNIIKMATSVLLRRRYNTVPQIFIPFWLHCFIQVYSIRHIASHYDITYLSERGMDDGNHLLYNATNHEFTANWLQ